MIKFNSLLAILFFLPFIVNGQEIKLEVDNSVNFEKVLSVELLDTKIDASSDKKIHIDSYKSGQEVRIVLKSKKHTLSCDITDLVVDLQDSESINVLIGTINNRTYHCRVQALNSPHVAVRVFHK